MFKKAVRGSVSRLSAACGLVTCDCCYHAKSACRAWPQLPHLPFENLSSVFLNTPWGLFSHRCLWRRCVSVLPPHQPMMMMMFSIIHRSFSF